MAQDTAAWRLALQLHFLALGSSLHFILTDFQGTLSLHFTWFEPLFSGADSRLKQGLGFKRAINSLRDVRGWILLDDYKE